MFLISVRCANLNNFSCVRSLDWIKASVSKLFLPLHSEPFDPVRVIDFLRPDLKLVFDMFETLYPLYLETIWKGLS